MRRICSLKLLYLLVFNDMVIAQFRHFIHAAEKYVQLLFDVKFLHSSNFLNIK